MEAGLEFVVVSFIEFEGGGFQAKPLMFGTLEQCQRMADAVPGVAYSGDRRPKAAWISVRRAENWTGNEPDSIRAIPTT